MAAYIYIFTYHGPWSQNSLYFECEANTYTDAVNKLNNHILTTIGWGIPYIENVIKKKNKGERQLI